MTPAFESFTLLNFSFAEYILYGYQAEIITFWVSYDDRFSVWIKFRSFELDLTLCFSFCCGQIIQVAIDFQLPSKSFYCMSDFPKILFASILFYFLSWKTLWRFQMVLLLWTCQSFQLIYCSEEITVLNVLLVVVFLTSLW